MEEFLELAALIAVPLAGFAGALGLCLRGTATLKWSLPLLLVAIVANVPLIELANARDPEAGPMGLLFLSGATIVGVALFGVAGLIHLSTAHARREEVERGRS